MPRTHKRERIERGLYRIGSIYWVCATPPDERQAQWLKVGAVGIMEARRKRDEFAHRVASGGLPPVRKKMTVLEVAADWSRHLDELVDTEQLRARTRSSYRDGVNLHVLPMFGRRQITSITAEDLVGWHDAQRALGSATWSIRARWMGFRSLLGFATRTGRIPTNPADALTRRERPKPGRSKNRFLSQREIRTLVQATDERGSLIVAMLLFGGLRAAELLGLTWEDIDFDERVIRVRAQMSRQGKRVPQKTDAGRRDVVLMDELAQILRRRRLAARFSGDTDLVIANGVGRTLGYTKLRKSFAKAREIAGLVDVTPHTCRHTFASILIDQGRSVEFVSQQLGHTSTKTTWDTYVHLFRAREHADAARRDLDAAYGRMLRGAGGGTTK